MSTSPDTHDTHAWMRKRACAGIVAATLVWTIPGVGLAQEEVVLVNGKQEYHAYCANCHGAQARPHL